MNGNANVHVNAPLMEIGILTIGKPTLSMALSSLLLQDEQRIRIHIVDTAPQPIIDRVEVQSVLRLAADRGIRCTYDHLHDDKRAFSLGRLSLLAFASTSFAVPRRTLRRACKQSPSAPTCRPSQVRTP